MSSEVTLTDVNFEEEVIKSARPVLVDFWAPWCGPCRAVGPVIEELAKEYAGKIKVCKLNTDDNPVSAGDFKITAIPSILLFKGGAVVNRLVGLQPKAELVRQLNSLL